MLSLKSMCSTSDRSDTIDTIATIAQSECSITFALSTADVGRYTFIVNYHAALRIYFERACDRQTRKDRIVLLWRNTERKCDCWFQRESESLMTSEWAEWHKTKSARSAAVRRRSNDEMRYADMIGGWLAVWPWWRCVNNQLMLKRQRGAQSSNTSWIYCAETTSRCRDSITIVPGGTNDSAAII